MQARIRTLLALSILTTSLECRSGVPGAPGLHVIRGKVSDSSTSAPVAAYVSLLDSAGGVFTAPTGEFELRLPRPVTGNVVLWVRRIGYEPRRIPIEVRGDTVKDVGMISLKQAAVQLDDLIVDTPRRAPR